MYKRQAPMFEKDDGEEIVLLDCACGKSYLSFVMNYYLHNVLRRRCRVIGVDINEHVIEESRAMAKRLGYHNMVFQCADLRAYQPPKNVTAVISLHACDIATDLASVSYTHLAGGCRCRYPLCSAGWPCRCITAMLCAFIPDGRRILLYLSLIHIYRLRPACRWYRWSF